MRLITYINEKVSKKDQEDALKANITVGAEFEFKLDGIETGISKYIKRQYRNAQADWEEIKQAMKDWEEELEKLDNDIGRIQEQIDELESNYDEMDEDDYIQQLEALQKKFQDKQDEEDNLRDEPPYYDIDVSDYTFWMSEYQGFGDLIDLLDRDLPKPGTPEALGMDGNLEDFFQWRETVEPIVENMADEAWFIDKWELTDYGESKQSKGDTYWKFEYDATVSPDGGVELVSPPMPISEMIEILPDVFKLIKKFGYTDGDCGLHFHMSTETGELDLTKLVFFTEEENIYKYFPERVGSTYANSLKNKIKNVDGRNISLELNKGLRKVPKKSDLIKTLQKYDAINHIKGNRVEFRQMGGNGYENKFNDIKNILARHAFALAVATDPEYRKEEYIKRIVRVLNKIERGFLEYKKEQIKFLLELMEVNDRFPNMEEFLSNSWSLYRNWDEFTPRIKSHILRIVKRELKSIENKIKSTGVKFDHAFYGSTYEESKQIFDDIYNEIDKFFNRDKEFNKLARR